MRQRLRPVPELLLLVLQTLESMVLQERHMPQAPGLVLLPKTGTYALSSSPCEKCRYRTDSEQNIRSLLIGLLSSHIELSIVYTIIYNPVFLHEYCMTNS